MIDACILSHAIVHLPRYANVSVYGNHRIADQEILSKEVAAWEKRRNAANAKVDWRFTTEDARITLKRPYPKISA